MSLTLYAYPFAAYCWKVLIALYENATPFTYRLVENEAGWAELESLWPIKISSRLKGGRPAAPSPWRTVLPPQRFSTPIGCIQSAIDFRELSPTVAGFLPGPLSPASWMRRVHSASSSLRERRIGTDKRHKRPSAQMPPIYIAIGYPAVCLRTG
jgi:hypothetical protein